MADIEAPGDMGGGLPTDTGVGDCLHLIAIPARLPPRRVREAVGSDIPHSSVKREVVDGRALNHRAVEWGDIPAGRCLLQNRWTRVGGDLFEAP